MKFRTAYDISELMPSPVGEPIYKWSYVTDDGEVVEEERNFEEMIQSSLNQTNYKEIIEQYGLDTDIIERRGDAIYGDTTQFGSTLDDFGNRIRALYQDLEQAVVTAKQGQTTEPFGVQGSEDTKIADTSTIKKGGQLNA